MNTAPLSEYWCAFCGKNSTEVEAMIRGDSAAICNECVDVCNTTIAEYRQTQALNSTPEEIPCHKLPA